MFGGIYGGVLAIVGAPPTEANLASAADLNASGVAATIGVAREEAKRQRLDCLISAIDAFTGAAPFEAAT
jgi:hypothetical protein